MDKNNQVALYRHFDCAGELLYVGISADVAARFRQHKSSSSWFLDVSLVTIEWFDDRQSAKLAEGKAIRSELPKRNVLKGAAEPKMRKAKPVKDSKTVFMKVRVTKDEQAEWREICRVLEQDFSTIVRDTMKRHAISIKRKREPDHDE